MPLPLRHFAEKTITPVTFGQVTADLTCQKAANLRGGEFLHG
jgi:hypothetical protein